MRAIRTGLALAAAVTAAACDCDSIKREADELKAQAQACQQGDACVVVSLDELAGANNCLGPFQCSAAFNARADREAFGRRARELTADFKSCGECATAECAVATAATCNAATGRCELR